MTSINNNAIKLLSLISFEKKNTFEAPSMTKSHEIMRGLVVLIFILVLNISKGLITSFCSHLAYKETL